MIEQSIGSHTDATHEMALSAISSPYFLLSFLVGGRIKRYALSMWNVKPQGQTDQQVAQRGLDQMEAHMKEIDLVMSIKDLGVTGSMFEDIAKVISY